MSYMSTSLSTPHLLDYSEKVYTLDVHFASESMKSSRIGTLYEGFSSRRRCPYCGGRAEKILDAQYHAQPDEFGFAAADSRFVLVWGCPACGWWYLKRTRLDETDLLATGRVERDEHWSVLRTF